MPSTIDGKACGLRLQAEMNKGLVTDIGALRFVVQALAELILARARISPAEFLKMIEPSIEKIGDEETSEQIRKQVGPLLGARPGFRVIAGGKPHSPTP